MTSRRDLLKYFGIGAAIVPVVGGVPRLESPAKLIAPPTIEPIQVVRSVDPCDLSRLEGEMLGRQQMEIEVYFRSGKETWHFKADTFIVKSQVGIVDVTSHDHRGMGRKMVPHNLPFYEWKLEGVCSGNTTCEVLR